ncbi:hypothetical protein MFIFM68171_10328 [Madurella fahalii]|uniref:Uncharacterized protein n=1 Tax=Madurella fahalii TaxID=1157608 RepID=A0ABQ0GQV2_9PEZI
MASTRTPTSGGSPDILRHPEAHGKVDGIPGTQIEDKKKRLRELRDNHACVRIIVNHIGRHYRTTKPPPWLDLCIVAEQLQRSTRLQSAHAAWVSLRASLASVRAWMGNHGSWRNAAVSRMPYLGTPSEIMAVAFLHSKGPGLPKGMITQLVGETDLEFLLDRHRPDRDKLPPFWKGAELESPRWRRQFMEKPPFLPGLPFDDDLTDLVLSTMYLGGKSDRKDKQQFSLRSPPQEIADVDVEDKSSVSSASANTIVTKKRVKTENSPSEEDDGELWANDVQATMSSITEPFKEVIAAEESRLLGKRPNLEDTVAHDSSKRQKTVEEDARSQRPISSIEDSDSSSAFSALSIRLAKIEGECRMLTVKYKRLKQQDRKLLNAYNKLEDSAEKLRKQIEQTDTWCQRLLTESAHRDEQYRCLNERCSKLEEKNKQLEDGNKGLQERMTVVAAHMKALEQEDTRQPEAGLSPPTAREDEAKDGLSSIAAADLPQFPSPLARHRNPKRSLANLPRIPRMPTFDIHPVNRQHYDGSNNTVAGYTYQSCLTRYSNTTTATSTSASASASAGSITSVSTHTAATLPAPPRPTSPISPNPANHPLVQNHLSWLPPHHRIQLVAYLANLDPQVWRLSDKEVVAYCQENGVRYARLHEVVVCFRRVLGQLEFDMF